MKNTSNLAGSLIAIAACALAFVAHARPDLLPGSWHWGPSPAPVNPTQQTEFLHAVKGLQADLATGLRAQAQRIRSGEIGTGKALTDNWKNTRNAAFQRNFGWIEQGLQDATGNKFDPQTDAQASETMAARVEK